MFYVFFPNRSSHLYWQINAADGIYPSPFADSKTVGCGIFRFCLLLFPQNERNIYKLRQPSLSHFVYFLSTEPSMFTFTKERIL